MSLNFLVNCPLSLPSSSSSPPSPFPWNRKPPSSFLSFARPRVNFPGGFRVGAFLFDPTRDPILKDALKEPIAFMGGMFAGLLRLDLNEDPLREWVARTADAAGITEEETGNGDIQSEESPQQIQIE
ncbi:UPF0426 protein At1g28150, chloroplastic [Coffea eugenioides]|uniref:UPF0426 protein At1g28150, chloroplastic n=1 Tax=Coffea arabica TaxID=13443 RepID=A0A6P6X865_COFAR|nr:UPF0426 protein At1g28150, chloroplastic-like [Coffea arabica]XP_027154754.1 UPF0426 protein At1g28150, chloroplastic [Coffea eugenioides]